MLSLINNSVHVSSQKYISLGQNDEDDHIGQMEHPLSGIKIHNIVLALSKYASIKVAEPTLVGTKVNILFILFSFLFFSV